jgi:hypothetical protein
MQSGPKATPQEGRATEGGRDIVYLSGEGPGQGLGPRFHPGRKDHHRDPGTGAYPRHRSVNLPGFLGVGD